VNKRKLQTILRLYREGVSIELCIRMVLEVEGDKAKTAEWVLNLIHEANNIRKFIYVKGE